MSAVKDPNAFGRTALIEALKRAGVQVRANPVGPNPVRRLPRTYQGAPTAARYTSPTYAQYAKLILKVSHNLGANLGMCLMATRTGSNRCEDGFPVLARFLERAQVDRKAVQLADGRGGNPADRTTPRALAQILTYWQRTSRRRASAPHCRSWASTEPWRPPAAPAPHAARSSPRPAPRPAATSSTTDWP